VTDEGPAFTFLTVEDVLSLHEDAINTWGGTHGIRDRALLESAVGAARNVALYDETADIFDVAAGYAYHVAQNQPFLDGNKRAGLAAAAACLFVNGIDLPDQEEDGESVLAKAMNRRPKGVGPSRAVHSRTFFVVFQGHHKTSTHGRRCGGSIFRPV
jgi:death-on-curing family protein